MKKATAKLFIVDIAKLLRIINRVADEKRQPATVGGRDGPEMGAITNRVAQLFGSVNR